MANKMLTKGFIWHSNYQIGLNYLNHYVFSPCLYTGFVVFLVLPVPLNIFLESVIDTEFLSQFLKTLTAGIREALLACYSPGRKKEK